MKLLKTEYVVVVGMFNLSLCPWQYFKCLTQNILSWDVWFWLENTFYLTHLVINLTGDQLLNDKALNTFYKVSKD